MSKTHLVWSSRGSDYKCKWAWGYLQNSPIHILNELESVRVLILEFVVDNVLWKSDFKYSYDDNNLLHQVINEDLFNYVDALVNNDGTEDEPFDDNLDYSNEVYWISMIAITYAHSIYEHIRLTGLVDPMTNLFPEYWESIDIRLLAENRICDYRLASFEEFIEDDRSSFLIIIESE